VSASQNIWDSSPAAHPLTLDGRDPKNLRGDKISGDRYWSKEFAQREWNHLWTRHVAGCVREIPESGDFVVRDFAHESVICVRHEDSSIRAFYNACRHRGQRVVCSASTLSSFQCAYHGGVWDINGELKSAPDPDSFSLGNLVESSSFGNCVAARGAV
jgi:phenylpropionate dioxygenase-like ring-hydroxylating dioxygenase large terminal subunit